MKAGKFQQLGVDFENFLPYFLSAFEDPFDQERFAKENQAEEKHNQECSSLQAPQNEHTQIEKNYDRDGDKCCPGRVR